MREMKHVTRRDVVSVGSAATVGGALLALSAANIEASGASPGANNSKLPALGRAWAHNLEQQNAAEEDCQIAATPDAFRQADARWGQLMTEEMKLSKAIRAETASTPHELALKARVILREISLTPIGQDLSACDADSIDWTELDLGQAIAVSLALDVLKLSRAA